MDANFAKGGSTPTEKEIEDTPPLSFTANSDNLISWAVYGSLSQSGTPTPDSPIYPSECGDLVNTGEHSGEYVLPVQCGGVTTNVYTTEPIRALGEYVDYKSDNSEYRAIKKLVLTGDETPTTVAGITATNVYQFLNETSDYKREPFICSHMPVNTNSTTTNTHGYIGQRLTICFDKALGLDTTDKVKTYLSEQYAANTPVTVWYVLDIPTTTTVEAPVIPTASGSNTLSVGTTVQPSSVYIKYTEGGDEMVTLAKIGGRYNTPILEIRGLSTDTKPTTKIEGMVVTNGSTYIEIDTGDTYMFDAENGVWHNITG